MVCLLQFDNGLLLLGQPFGVLIGHEMLLNQIVSVGEGVHDVGGPLHLLCPTYPSNYN